MRITKMRSGKNPLSLAAIKALGSDKVPSLAILATITVLESMTDDKRAELKDYKANPTAGHNFLSNINDNVLEKLVLWSDENGLLLSFIAACQSGLAELVHYYIFKKVDIHAADDAALQWAAEEGHTDTLKVLLEAGADVHAGNDGALRWAAEEGQTKTVEVLLATGADVHADNDYALRWAAEKGQTKTVEVLLAAGADVHADNDFALRFTACKGHTKTVEVLLAGGADVQALSDYSLRLAACNGHTETVKVLLAAGAEDDGALELAAQFGHTETAQVLKHWIANERVLVDLCRSYRPIKESILQQLIQSDDFKQSLANPSSYVENDRQGCPIEQQLPLCFPNSPLSLSVKGDGPWTLMHYLKEEAKQNPNTERLIALPLHVGEQAWVSLVLSIDKGNQLSSVCLMACPSNSSQSPQAFNDLLALIYQQLRTHYPKFDRGIELYSMPQKKLPTSDQEAPRVSTAVLMTSNLQRMVRRAYFSEDFTLIERQRNDKPSAPSTSTSSTFNTDLFKPGRNVGNEARNDDDNNESGSITYIDGPC